MTVLVKTVKLRGEMSEGSDIITQGAAAAGFAKVLVELVKMTTLVSARNLLPVLAFIFAEGCAFLLMAAQSDAVFNRQSIAVTVLTGIGATAGAIAATALQTRADKVEERVQAALDLPAGSDKKDVEQAMKETG